MSERKSSVLSALDPEQWRLVCVLSSERKLTQHLLDRLGLAPATCQWAFDAGGNELWLDGGVAFGLPYTRSFSGERAITINPKYRPLILRRAAARGEFLKICEDGKLTFGEQSQSPLITAFYAGDLSLLMREVRETLRRSVRGEDAILIRSRLHEAVCSSFDAEFLLRTWNDSTWLLVEQVLADALVALAPVTVLLDFARKGITEHPSGKLRRLLAEHAWLRGDTDTLLKLTSEMSASEQVPFRITAQVLGGEMAVAREVLQVALGLKKPQKLAVPWSSSAIAFVALIALGQGASDGPAFVKRLLQYLAVADSSPIAGWPSAPANTAIARAIRILVRRMTRPDTERVQASPHYQALDAPSWETLLIALTVQLDEGDSVTRLAWAQRLIADSERWKGDGYAWMAHQAVHLAYRISPARVAESGLPLPSKPGEILLGSLLEQEPEWRRALRVLEQFADTADRGDGTVSRRVAWFVDMSTGELAKPALEEYRNGTGWTRGRRVDFSELRACKGGLPSEDTFVLSAIDAAPRGASVPSEALEALCGHPRVFDGTRGRQRVEVVRGHCRIQTRDERGQLIVELEPAGAVEGVNVVVEDEKRITVYRVEAALAKLISALPKGICIPQNQARDGLLVLARLAEHMQVDSAALGALRTVAADSNPCLRISPEAGAFWVEVGVRPFGEFGRFFPPGLGRSTVAMHSGEEVFDTERNLGEEMLCFQALLTRCKTLADALLRDTAESLTSSGPSYSASVGEEELYGMLAELKELGSGFSLEWKNSKAICSKGKVTSASLQGSLRRVKGWYLVNGSVQIEDVSELNLGDLLRMPFTKSGRFVRLPSGDFLEVEQRVRQVLAKLASVAQLPLRGSVSDIRVPEAAIDVLKSLVDTASDMAVEASLASWIAKVDTVFAAQPLVPGGLQAVFRPYQLEGFRWLWANSSLGLGLCLADDMGLGKTLQVIALLISRCEGGPVLVIAPTSVCSNWLDELTRFAPSLRAVEYTGRTRVEMLRQFGDEGKLQAGESKKVDVLIASYALLQQDSTELTAVEWNTVVLDEAQFIKNPLSLRAKAAFGLSARYRVAMTGTPVENHLGDLWSIFHFLNPHLLGSMKHFQLAYLKPIERDRDSEQQALLKKLVSPFLLRRRKDEVLADLPPITTLRHEVRFTEDESVRYALLRKAVHEKLRTSWGKRDHKLQVLAEITRLRRFCCHPRLVFPDAPLEASKMQTFLMLVEELRDNGHRALVFSQFVDFLEIVREHLDERKIRYLYLDGSTPKEARHQRVQAFQSGDTELFLISLKAGGFGLNLTGADYVIHLDPWWNPAVEAQATDRAHRIGQERPVTVYRLVTKDSIEERIVELHREKRAIADALLDDTGAYEALSGEQLASLLQLE